MTSDGDFFAHPWHSSVNTTDKGSKESPVTCTDTDGSVTAPSTGVVSCLPHNESQASLMTLVGIADDNDDRHVCCDGNVSMRVDADEEFLQEFVFGTSAFQVSPNSLLKFLRRLSGRFRGYPGQVGPRNDISCRDSRLSRQVNYPSTASTVFPHNRA